MGALGLPAVCKTLEKGLKVSGQGSREIRFPLVFSGLCCTNMYVYMCIYMGMQEANNRSRTIISCSKESSV